MAEHGFAPSGEAMIYFHSEGEGSAVLFLHAGVADSRMWQAQMELPGHRAIVFDQRGFGRTRWVTEPYANRGDALAVLDHLDVDRAVVVGCSNGGEAAMQMALVAPSRVAALVLVGAAPRGWAPEGGWGDEPFWEEIVAAFKAGDFETVVDYEARLWLAGPGRSLDDIDPGVVALFKEMDLTPQSTEMERNEQVQTLEPPTNDRLDQIDVPTLVIVGEHDTAEMHQAAHYLAERVSDRSAVIIENSAHLPSLEKPKQFNAVLTDFLGQI